jgi:long-subunit fatty acid transport protein
MMNRQTRILRGAAAALLAAAGLLAEGAPAAAQSLLASRGLGYVNPPVDGRARGLGGAALALPGGGLSLVNPAAISALPAPAITMAFQPDFYTSALPGQDTDGTTARFPLLNAVFPFGTRWTFSAGFGSYLDQTWAVETSDTLSLPGRRVAVTDRFASRGGVTRIRGGAAYSFTERLSVGVGADLYTGSVRDTLSRRFAATDTVSGRGDLVGASYSTEWSYRALGASLGVRWVPSDALNLAASVSAAGTLEGRPAEDDSLSVGRDYSLPLTFDVGASGRVTPNALVVLNAQWAGWSAANEDLARVGGARDAWMVAGGVELGNTTAGVRSFPLRVGARYATLPFRWGPESAGAAFPDEKALTAGLGARLAGGAAQVDLGGERGWRGGGDSVLDESYWRMTLSLTLLGR